jgi:cytochrome c553
MMSPRTGRPKTENPINRQITVRLTEQTMRRLKAYCEEKQITKGEAVRKGVEKLLDEQ